MQSIRTAAEAANIADPELRHLIQKTIRDLSPDGPYDSGELGYFLIVEPGDTLATINAKIGFDILANRWTGKCFDQPGYTQSFEILDEHAGSLRWFSSSVTVAMTGWRCLYLNPQAPQASKTAKQRTPIWRRCVPSMPPRQVQP